VLLIQESLKLLYRELEDDSGVEGEGAAGDGDESWNDQFYRHVDVVAADRVFTDNSDAVVNTETRSVAVTPGRITLLVDLCY